MRASPYVMGMIYLAMGILFTYLAMGSVTDTVWNFSTILLALIATFDFVVAIRMFTLKSRLKKLNKKK